VTCGGTSRLTASLLLALVGSVLALVAPGYGYAQSPSGPGTNVVATVSSWVLTGNLNIPRSGHTATLLADGRVLVVGGHVGCCDAPGTILDSAELYDPLSGTWSTTGHLGKPRQSHTATLLPNGQVLVTGGYTGIDQFAPTYGFTDTAELYNPATGTWSATSNLHALRNYFAATLLPNGRVLVAGDFFHDNQACEIYDPSTGAWTLAGRLNAPRAGHMQSPLANGNVLVAGGFKERSLDDDVSVDSAEIYDVATDTWSTTSPLKLPIRDASATLLANGKVLVAGGVTNGTEINVGIPLRMTQLFDLNGGFGTSGDLLQSRSEHTATLMASGKVLVVGGADSSHAKSVEIYDPAVGTWASTSDINIARSGHTATLLTGGKVLVAGGNSASDPSSVLGSAEVYQQVADNSFRITGLFSDQAGLFQYIQLTELSGLDGQNQFTGRTLTVTSSKGITKTFTFTHDLPSSQTSHRAVLIGTQFGGNVDPNLDFVIPAGFLPTDGGTLNFSGIDSWTFTSLPTDGWAILLRSSGPSYLQNFFGSAIHPLVVLDPVIEYYNAALDHYFISGSQPDLDALDSGRLAGWTRTGFSFGAWMAPTFGAGYLGPAPPPNLLGVCRIYIPPVDGDSHFFSASASECATSKAQHPEFVLETPTAFFATLPDPITGACGNNQTPVYRVWNARVDSNHRYTTSLAVRDQMVAIGYVKEGYGPNAVTICVGGYS